MKRERVAAWLLWALAAVQAVALVRFVAASAAHPPVEGFITYYTTARLLLEGDDLHRVVDGEWLRGQMRRFQPDADDINPNLPPAMLLALPLAWLDYPTARAAWAGLALCGLALAGGALLWRLGLRGWLLPACIAFGLTFQPLYADLYRGQSYTPMLLALVVAWWGLQSGRAKLLGGGLACALLIRIVGVPFWPWLLLTRRWRAVAWGVGITSAVCLVLMVRLPEAWRTTLPWLQRMTSGPQTTVTAYQTLQSWSGHLLAYDAYWNPEPWIRAPLLATWLSRAVSAVVVVATLYVAWRATHQDLAFALLVLAGLVVSPVSQGYHYTLALLPIVLLVAWVRDRHVRGLWVWLAAGAALIAANAPYQSPALRAGLWALLAYPKLYGALLLWGLALLGARQPAWAQVRGRLPEVEGRPSLRAQAALK